MSTEKPCSVAQSGSTSSAKSAAPASNKGVKPAPNKTSEPATAECFAPMEYGLIGEHLGHSFSVEIHASLGDYDYRLCELAPEEVGGFLQARAFRGINVTIPYKQTVMPYLDEIDAAAVRIGAVNTVLCRAGRLVGYNTDFYGMRDLIRRTGIDMSGRFVAILGTGGTSRTALAVADSLGAGKVVRVSRHPGGEGEISYDELGSSASQVQVLINTTPLGMFPKEDGMAVDPADFPVLEGAVDAVYHPLRTNFICRAIERGVPAAGGLYMLVSQAAHAAALFFNDSSVTDKTDSVFRALLGRKQNIVLIGMPGSGKSTLGRLISERRGCEFFDCDSLFGERYGVLPCDFITKEGEDAFRHAESSLLRELAARSGCVIATGGGAVTRPENVAALRRNGLIVFLDRPLADITPTPDRPLSCDRAALEARYRERLPLYRAAAGLTVCVSGTPEETAVRLCAAVDAAESRQ